MPETRACRYSGKGVNERETYWVVVEPANVRQGPYHWRCAFEAKTDIEIGHTLAPMGVPKIKVSVLLELVDR